MPKIKWFHLLELLLPIYLIWQPLYASINSTTLFEVSANQYIAWYLLALGFIGVFLAITYLRVGKDDFRFKLFVHLVFLAVGVGVTVLQIKGTGLLDIFNNFNGRNVSDVIRDATLVNLFSAVFILGALMGIYDLIEPMKAEMENISTTLEQGKELKIVVHPQFYNDKVLGPPIIKLFNVIQTVQLANLQAVQMADTMKISIEELSANTEELNAESEEITAVTQSIAQGTMNQADYLDRIVTKLAEARQFLKKIIEEIETNASLVSNIALQTNILALNAGIEASRAGDYGRGFAVVAENVRRLSEESSSTASLIKEVVENVANNLNTLFSEIQQQIENVAAIAEETASSSEEVVASIEEMTSLITHIVSAVTHISELSDKNIQLFDQALRSVSAKN